MRKSWIASLLVAVAVVVGSLVVAGCSKKPETNASNDAPTGAKSVPVDKGAGLSAPGGGGNAAAKSMNMPTRDKPGAK